MTPTDEHDWDYSRALSSPPPADPRSLADQAGLVVVRLVDVVAQLQPASLSQLPWAGKVYATKVGITHRGPAMCSGWAGGGGQGAVNLCFPTCSTCMAPPCTL